MIILNELFHVQWFIIIKNKLIIINFGIYILGFFCFKKKKLFDLD